MNDLFEGDQDLISYVQRAIGYSLTGSTAEQCLFILIGDGANGKSTFVNVMSKLLGDYSKAAASQTLVAKGSTSRSLKTSSSARLIPLVGSAKWAAERILAQPTGSQAAGLGPCFWKTVCS